jgi:carboxyl-terminal processing protease
MSIVAFCRRRDPALRRGRLAVRAATAVLACVLLSAQAQAAAQQPAPAIPIDRELALLTFDSVWSRIAHTHYDTAFAGVDWHGVRHELRPLAAEAGSLDALRRVITAMLDRLGESHYALIPAEAADALGSDAAAGRHLPGDAGLAVRLVDGELLVWRVAADGAAARAGVRTGWTVLAIDGRPLAPRLDRLAALPAADRRTALTRLLFQVNAELEGDVGASRQLELRDEAGAPVVRMLTLEPGPGEMVGLGNLPPMRAALEHEAVTTADGCIGVIRMNVWMVPLMPAFDRAIDALRGCAGMVIDLRGNPGGVAGMVMGTAGHFLSDTLPLGFMRTRSLELRFKANPRRVGPSGSAVEPFAGPLAVLVDEMSASTSEFFAAGLQGVGRARVFGSPSAGQALPALLVRLPTDDVLMHAIADFTGPGGIRIEGRGVLPDVPVNANRHDLLRGIDAPFDAALHWIRQSASPPTGGDPSWTR